MQCPTVTWAIQAGGVDDVRHASQNVLRRKCPEPGLQRGRCRPHGRRGPARRVQLREGHSHGDHPLHLRADVRERPAPGAVVADPGCREPGGGDQDQGDRSGGLPVHLPVVARPSPPQALPALSAGGALSFLGK